MADTTNTGNANSQAKEITVTYTKRVSTPVTPEDIKDIEGLQTKLEQELSRYEQQNKKAMHALTLRLLSNVSEELTHVQARYNRQLRAKHRKAHKQL